MPLNIAHVLPHQLQLHGLTIPEYIVNAGADECAKIAATNATPPDIENTIAEHHRITQRGILVAKRVVVIEAECQRIAPPTIKRVTAPRFFMAPKY